MWAGVSSQRALKCFSFSKKADEGKPGGRETEKGKQQQQEKEEPAFSAAARKNPARLLAPGGGSSRGLAEPSPAAAERRGGPSGRRFAGNCRCCPLAAFWLGKDCASLACCCQYGAATLPAPRPPALRKGGREPSNGRPAAPEVAAAAAAARRPGPRRKRRPFGCAVPCPGWPTTFVRRRRTCRGGICRAPVALGQELLRSLRPPGEFSS